MRLCTAIVALALCCFGTARAQNFDGTPLASCPGYIANHPIVSELSWTVNCFLQALYDKNRALAVAIAPHGKCLPQDPDHCIDGIIDEMAAIQFFRDGYPGTSLHDLVTGTKAVVVTFETSSQPNDHIVYATFLVAPEKSKVNVVQGFMVDFFECDFAFDKGHNIWTLDGICRLDVAEVDRSLEVDMSGAASDFPAMVWRPKNR